MHTLYFVKVKNKENAFDRVSNLLEANGFAGQGGFYSSSKADYFNIGGRWAGLMTTKTAAYKEALELSKHLLVEETKKWPELIDYLYINPNMVDKNKRIAIDEIFSVKTDLPYFRDSFGETEYPDNIFQITTETLPILQKEYSDTEVAVALDDNYIDEEITCKDLTDKNIGEYLVIVDYHN